VSIEEIIPNERLKHARYQMGLTQSELAEKVGTTFETVSRWERGIKVPSPYYRRRLCEVFSKTVEELGFLTDSEAFPKPNSTLCVFLSSAYADADLKFVDSLKMNLQAYGITIWSSRIVRRQETRNKRNVLQEAIRASQVVLLIVSPRTQSSHHVHDTLQLARHFNRPVCVVWIDGEDLQQCIPQDYGEQYVTIDARNVDEQFLSQKIAMTLEQRWLTPKEADIAALYEHERNTPVRLKPLVGREKELERLSELLQSKQIRLVTLLGPGGIGKTHLGMKITMELRKRFADGICVVSLSSIKDHMLVVPAIAKELRIREIGDSTLIEQVKVALRNRQMLLLLDNFEQVQESASRLAELLENCPHLKLLVTSRVRLHIQGEYEFFVPPLALPDLTKSAANDVLAQNAAVTLFIQRAQDAKPEFRINTVNVRTIAEICIRLDGLPLAIELAAARMKSFSSQALLARLEEHLLDVVISRDQDVSDRQRTLRSTIAWSYELLDTTEQQLFQRLAAFTGSWSLEAVEAMYHTLGEETIHVWNRIESLLDKSLLRSAEQEGEGRLRLLETIREYGLEHLEASGEAEAVLQAHAKYYLNLVEEAEPQLKSVNQVMWLARLDQEQGNLRAALRWFSGRGESEFANRLCGELWWFWRLRGYWSEGRRWLEAALKLPQTGEPTLARARALLAAGDLAYYQDGNLIARSFLEESVSLCRTLVAERDLAIALGTLGVLLHMQDDRATADPLLEESEKLSRRLGSNWELSYLLRKLAEHAAQAGELGQASLYAQESFVLAKKLGDKSLIATVLSTLGNIAARENDLTQAIAYNQECLALARGLSDKLLIALALNNLGFFTALRGDAQLTTYTQAQEALTLMRELGDNMYITRTLQTVGYVATHQDTPGQAKIWYREALSIAVEIQSAIEIGLSLWGLALVAIVERQFLLAARLFGAAEARIDIKVDMYPAERAEYERAKDDVRSQLGGKTFATARNEGRVMSLEQALASAWSPAAINLPPSPGYPDGLTEREVEVLCLLAKGYTDEQIAKQLVIAPRTVNSHLTIIYRKIGVSSDGKERQIAPRIAATRYVIEHDLC
jgi:predicted ATPase/DNA-binding CsgD family transcriptional regulator/transcriptional regulator with XRE-family HTH domain